MAPECAAFMKQVVLRLADKRQDDYQYPLCISEECPHLSERSQWKAEESRRKTPLMPNSALDYDVTDAYEAF